MEIKPPKHESIVGIEAYKSKTLGIGGVIKQIPEDFMVEEISPEGLVYEAGKGLGLEVGSEKDYIHLTLEKCGWDNLRAIKELSRHLHISPKRIGFAGTKDKKALTTQRISIKGIKAEDISRVRIKDIILRDPSYSVDDIGLGSLYGNRFTVTIRKLEDDADEVKKKTEKIIHELRGVVPSFYGTQRFGTTRPITHLVGREMLNGDFESAVMVYLSMDFPGEDEELRKTRRSLKETRDFRAALRDFPKHLGFEHALLNYLAQNPEDYRGALRSLPKTLTKMFIHAHQSYIYNKALSRYMQKGIPVDRLPLPGYATEVDEVTAEVMAEEGVSKEDYRVKGMSDLGSRGEYRECFTPVEGLDLLEASEDDLNKGKRKMMLRFSLRKGNYATVVLREIMKN